MPSLTVMTKASFLLKHKSSVFFADVVSEPDPNQLNKLLPCELDSDVDFILVVQVNVFDCGGTTIGVCISHKIADVMSLVMFLNCWAFIARGDNHDYTPPTFDLATFFPPRSISGFKPGIGIARDKIVTKKLVFIASTDVSLRTKYTTGATGSRRLTRIEALSAFVWSRFLTSTQGKPDLEIVYKVLHEANLRTRMDPPLLEHHFGNMSQFATATMSFEDGDEECYGFVRQMREAIKSVDGQYMRKILESTTHVDYLKRRAEEFLKGEVMSFSFTSQCRFPLYAEPAQTFHRPSARVEDEAIRRLLMIVQNLPS